MKPFDFFWLFYDAAYCQVVRYTYQFFKKFPKQKHTLKIVTINGLKFKVRPGSSDSIVLLQNLMFYPQDLSALNHSNNTVIIDIGAHIGAFSLSCASQKPKTKILCFEPEHNNYQLLKENISLNRFQKQIKIFNFAVDKDNSPKSLFLDNLFPSAHSLNKVLSFSSKSVQVKCISLNQIFKQNRLVKCNLLKLDCEGSEYDILMTATKETLGRVGTILFEFHQTPEKLQQLTKHLILNGFEVKNQPLSRFLSSFPILIAKK